VPDLSVNPDNLIEKLDFLLSNLQKIAVHKLRSRKYVENRYDPNKIAQALKTLMNL
jgi:secreted Zn-dependent insulinase-like peptidase